MGVEINSVLGALIPLLNSLRKYESNYSSDAKAILQKALTSAEKAQSEFRSYDAAATGSQVAGWLLKGAQGDGQKVACASLTSSLTAVLSGGMPLPRSTKEELSDLKTQIQGFKVEVDPHQTTLAHKLTKLYEDAVAQRVDLDAVEVEVDEVVRNVLNTLYGVSKLEGEDARQELSALEEAVNQTQGGEVGAGVGAMLSLALNAMQRLHADKVEMEESEEEEEEGEDHEEAIDEEDDEDDPFFMPLPNAALKMADERKFKVLAEPIGPVDPAQAKPMLELADGDASVPSTPSRSRDASSGGLTHHPATPGLTADDFEPVPLELQKEAEEYRHMSTSQMPSPAAAAAGAAAAAAAASEIAGLRMDPGLQISDAAALDSAALLQQAADAVDAGPVANGRVAGSSGGAQGQGLQPLPPLEVGEEALASVGAQQGGAQVGSPQSAGAGAGTGGPGSPVSPQALANAAGAAQPGQNDDKIKQFVNFLQGENPGACMFHAQMRLSLDGCRKLSNFLASSSRVRALSLSHNFLGDDGMRIICEGLAKNRSVTAMDLPDNNITDVGCALLAEAIKGNPSLTQLQLAYNKIGDAGAAALADLIRGSHGLKKLGVAHNNIGKEGVQALVGAISANQSLKQLQLLPGNPVQEKDAKALAKALKRNKKFSIKNLLGMD